MDLNPKVGYFYVYLGFYLALITPLDTDESCQPIDEYPSIYGKDALCTRGDEKNNNYCLQCRKYYKKVYKYYRKCRKDCWKCEYADSNDEHEHECRVCHKACLNYECYGPSARISKRDGCKKCNYGFINGTQKTCLIGSNNSTKICAHNQLYNYFLDKPNQSEINWTINICRECDSNCKRCSSFGNYHDLNECECKNFLKIMKIDGEERKLCSEDCPDDFEKITNLSANICICENYNSSTGLCEHTTNFILYIIYLILGIIILLGIIYFIYLILRNRDREDTRVSPSRDTRVPPPRDTRVPLPRDTRVPPRNSRVWARISQGSYEEQLINLRFYDQEPSQPTSLHHSIGRSSDHTANELVEKEPLKQLGKRYTTQFFHISRIQRDKEVVLRKFREDKEVVLRKFRENIDPNNKEILLEEFRIRSTYNHRFIHSCEIYEGNLIEEFYLIEKFYSNRDLKTFLKHKDRMILPHHLYLYCAQIAEAMNFLKKEGIIHGKLTIKEIFVESEDHIKLANLGLAIKAVDNRELKVKNMVPWHCLSLEQLKSPIPLFTFESDIWAFGVTCWQIFTFGNKSDDVKQPYAELNLKQDIQPLNQIDTKNLIRFLQTGKRLPKPKKCDPNTYNVLKNCWNIDPGSRPQFEILLQHFKKKNSKEKRLQELNAETFMDDDYEFKNKKRYAGEVKVGYKVENEAIDFELPTSEAVILKPSRASNFEPISINENDVPSSSKHIISNQNIYIEHISEL